MGRARNSLPQLTMPLGRPQGRRSLPHHRRGASWPPPLIPRLNRLVPRLRWYLEGAERWAAFLRGPHALGHESPLGMPPRIAPLAATPASYALVHDDHPPTRL
jgi:hypothetical protein